MNIQTTDQRIAEIQKELEKTPDSPDLLARLAAQFVQKFRETFDGSYLARAEASCDKALKKDPDHYPTLSLRPAIYNIQHRFIEAREGAKRAIDLNPTDTANHARLGDALMELGEYEQAEESYLLLSLRAPKTVWLPRTARLAELRGQVDQAQKLLEANVEQLEDSPYAEHRAWAHVQLGNLHLNQGRAPIAEKQYAAALEALPDFAMALTGMAQTKAALGRFDEAIEWYRRSVGIAPLHDSVVGLGDLYFHLGRQDEADQLFALVATVEKLNRAAGVLPDTPSILHQLDRDKNLPEALNLAREQAKHRKDIRTFDALAWAEYKNKNHAQALEAIKQAMRLGTRDPLLFFHHAKILHALMRDEEALASLATVMEINPHFHVRYSEEAKHLFDVLELGQ